MVPSKIIFACTAAMRLFGAGAVALPDPEGSSLQARACDYNDPPNSKRDIQVRETGLQVPKLTKRAEMVYRNCGYSSMYLTFFFLKYDRLGILRRTTYLDCAFGDNYIGEERTWDTGDAHKCYEIADGTHGVRINSIPGRYACKLPPLLINN